MIRSIFCIFIVLCGCSSSDNRVQEFEQWKSQNGHIKVLSTIAMINDVVKEVGDGYVDAISLVKGDLDPHSYQLVKGDDEKFHRADLIFYNGLGLEHGSSLQRYLQNSSKAIGLGDQLKEKYPERIILVKNQVDPHVWMDISLWQQIVPMIVSALSIKDPEHAQQYQENGEVLIKKMEQTHAEIVQLLSQIPPDQRYLVTSHDAFNYFSRAYLATPEERENGLWMNRFAAPEGLAPESQLSARDIQMIIDHLKQYNIAVLFPESNISQDSIRKIVNAGKEQGLELTIASTPLYGDAMGSPGSGGDTYLKMLTHNARTIKSYVNR